MAQLDETDKKILSILQEDGRITTKELAQKLHLTNTPVYERVKKLEKQGFIKQYVAILDPVKVERNMVIFLMVSLEKHTKDIVEEYKEKVLSFPEVMEFYYISGNFDSLLKLMVKDMDDFKRFIEEKFSVTPHIRQFQSVFSISEPHTKTSFEL